MTAEGCPFCARIDAGDYAVRWGTTVAFPPRNPVTPGHTLVLPVRHVADAAHDPDITAETMRHAAYLAAGAAPCNLITSIGAAATQTVGHLHIHVVPRRPGDGLALPWTGQTPGPAAPR